MASSIVASASDKAGRPLGLPLLPRATALPCLQEARSEAQRRANGAQSSTFEARISKTKLEKIRQATAAAAKPGVPAPGANNGEQEKVSNLDSRVSVKQQLLRRQLRNIRPQPWDTAENDTKVVYRGHEPGNMLFIWIGIGTGRSS
ncbi:putative FAD dependent oxidoreductase [Colletotrichum asianum]|uniref:Putative FAD dependent oxidoreductase n=1 Tax=Colletotrichum asianum TaxID=702518 RepID=A0A8H3W0I5_9PEZI|nr:putative FAD dependent oxidoreductase [Colletotrichum asianum]